MTKDQSRKLGAVGPHLAETLGDLWRGYRKQLKKCRCDASEDTVHELRVRTRRLMAKFHLLECVLSHRAVNRAQRVLKRRLKALGDLRDTQVQMAFIDERLAEWPDLVKLRAWLSRREQCLIDKAAKHVGRCRLGKLAKWIAALRRQLLRRAKDTVRQHHFAAAAVRAIHRAFDEVTRRRQQVRRSDLATIHRTRVAYKRFRYLVEAMPLGLAPIPKQQRVAMAAYQRMMGDIQDVEVLQACVAEFCRENPKDAPALRSFRRYLTRRRAQLVTNFLGQADALCDFWPPVGQSGQTARTPV